MQSFIFDYYGYNVGDISKSYFDFKGYRFMIIATSEEEQNIIKMEKLISALINNVSSDVVYLVKNRYNQYISLSESGKIILLAYKLEAITLNELVKMHITFLKSINNKVILSDIIKLWEQRIEYLENQCLVSLNFDNSGHSELYEQSMFAVGIAENALQYIADTKTDFGDNIFSSTLTHRRLKSVDKWDVFNPFNLTFDHSSRDLAELYKNDVINFEILMDICRKYSYQVPEYQYLLARILFPVSVFDLLEDIYIDKSYDYTDSIYRAIDASNAHLKKARIVYLYLINNYNIRPIRWLEHII